MISWFIAIWSINALTGIVFSVLMVTFRSRFNLINWLGDIEKGRLHNVPSFSVVIAARNEEDAIERTLREFAAIKGIAEVILVDDGSDDNTLQIGHKVAAEIPLVRVLEAPPLPSGWIGKTHALHWASKNIQSEYILFTDADVHLHQLPLPAIVSRMELEHLDHVGGNFRIEQACFAEAMTAPVIAAVAFISLGLSASRKGSATGAFNLIRTAVYRQMSGHLPVRDQVVDDVAFARCIKNRGFKSRFIDISPVLSVRLFRGWGGFVKAVSRSAVPFLGQSSILALGLSFLGVILSASVLLTPILLLTWFATGVCMEMPGLCCLAFAACCLSVLPFLIAKWLHSRSCWWGVASPIAFLIMTNAVVASAIRCMLGHKVRWRGRLYHRSGNSNG